MAVIHIPRRSYIQPQNRVVLASPWQDFIDAVYLPENPYSVDGAVEYGSARATTPRGSALRIEGGYASSSRVLLPSALNYSGRRVGVIAGILLNPSFAVVSSTYPHIWSVRDDSVVHASLLFGNDNTYRQPLAIGFNAGVTSSSIAREIPIPSDPMITVEGNGFGATGRIFLNGRQESLFATNSTTALPTHSVPACVGNRSTGGRAFPSEVGAIEYVIFLKQDITQEMREALHLNPYQVFKAEPHRIYSLPPVLTIPSLSNPGVIDITANSARPQVTLAY